jgi:hypothetical protein
VNVPSKSKRQKNFGKIVLVGVLIVKDENSRIWIHRSEARIRRSGSVPKCLRSTTLPVPLNCFLKRTGDREEEAVRLKSDLEKSEDNLRNLRMENGTLR